MSSETLLAEPAQGDKMADAALKCLVVVNDGPYGTERAYNALRTAAALARKPEAQVDTFLVGDGVQCAVHGQATPDGFYNVERMLQVVLRAGRVFT